MDRIYRTSIDIDEVLSNTRRRCSDQRLGPSPRMSLSMMFTVASYALVPLCGEP